MCSGLEWTVGESEGDFGSVGLSALGGGDPSWCFFRIRSMKIKRHRLNLELTSQVMARLNSLVEESDSKSKTDVIRKALALYETMARLQKEEGQVIFLLKNGTQRELVF